MSPVVKRIVEALAPPLAYGYLRLLRATVRRTYVNREALDRATALGGAQIYVFWHSRLAIAPFGYFRGRVLVLQSLHRDSRMLADVMSRFGLGQVWGSTTRGGMAAVRQVLRRIREGYDIAVAPDGPRGPRRRAQAGVIAIARLSGAPMIPMAVSARPFKRLGSWDRQLLPLPFGRAVYVYGEPMVVPRDADAQEQERWRERLEVELDRVTDLADTTLGVPLLRAAEDGARPERRGRRGRREGTG